MPDEMKRLPYADRLKLENGWKHYCETVNNQKPTIAQFVAWLQDIRGLRLVSAKVVVAVTTEVAAGSEVKAE